MQHAQSNPRGRASVKCPVPEQQDAQFLVEEGLCEQILRVDIVDLDCFGTNKTKNTNSLQIPHLFHIEKLFVPILHSR